MTYARFVVTGCGGSGTKWAAEVLTALGVPCGHEVAFNHRKIVSVGEGDSSWLAAPFAWTLGETPVIWIVRDPLAAVRSFMRTRMFRKWRGSPTPHTVYALTHCPEIKSPERLDRIVRYMAMWDAAMRDPLRVEDGPETVAAMLARIGVDRSEEEIERACEAVGTAVNTHRPELKGADAEITWARVMGTSWGHRLAAKAYRLGYEVPE